MMNKLYNSFVQNLSISYECSLSIGNSLILEEMLNEVIYTIVHKTNAHRGTIWLFKEKEELQMGARAGSRLTKEEITRKKLSYKTVFKQIYLNQKPIIKNREDKDFFQYCFEITGKEQSVLIVPIKNMAMLHLVYAVKGIADVSLGNMLLGLSEKLSLAIEACLSHENIKREIQVRQETEELLKYSEQQYRTTIDFIGKAIHVVDRNLNIVLFNMSFKQWNKKLGFETENLIGKNIFEVFPFLSDTVCDEYQRVFKTGKMLINVETNEFAGKIITTETRKIPILENNKVVRVITVIDDITERKQSEKIQLGLYNIANAVNTTKNLDELYKIIHKQLGKVIDTTNFYIADYNEETGEIIASYFVDEKVVLKVPFQLRKNGVTNYIIKNAKSLFLTEELRKELINKGEIDNYVWTSKSLLGVPLRIGIENKIVGCIVVRNYKEESKFPEKDISILELVSYQIAIAIERKKMEKELKNLYKKSEESRKSLLSILEDVSEKEVALRKSEERFQDVVTNSGDWIWEIDKEGCYTYCSPVVKQVLGYEYQEILGKYFYDFFIPDKKEEIKQAVLKAFVQKKSFMNFINRNIHKDGHEVILETNGIPLLNEKGDLVGYRGVDRDITARKKVEKIQKTLYDIANALNTTDNMHLLCQKVREFLGNVIDTKNFYIALYDEKTDVISLPFEVDEKDKYESFPAGKTLTKYVIRLEKPLFAPRKLQDELTVQGKIEVIGTPSEIWMGAPLKVENSVIGVIAVQSYDDPNLYTEKDIKILTFISEEIALAIKHKQAEEQMKRDLKEKELLLREIHHRVKNNLQVISGLLQLQENEITTKEDAIKGFAASQDRILAMAKAYELLLGSEYMSDVNVGKYIESLAEQLKRNYDIQKKVKISYSFDEVAIGIEILDRLGLVLNEIITNSIKYAFEGRDSGNINIELTEKKDSIVLVISDNGVGIPEDININNPDTLGLSLVEMLTTQLWGTLKLDRKNGTSFTLEIPKESKA